MKRILFSIALGLLLSGCATVPRDVAAQMSSKAKAYDSIKLAMNEKEVISRLGPPTEVKRDRSTWEMRHDGGNYESLIINFADSGKIKKIRREHRKRTKWAFGSSTETLYSERPSE